MSSSQNATKNRFVIGLKKEEATLPSNQSIKYTVSSYMQ
jgi:hypothetical protein